MSELKTQIAEKIFPFDFYFSGKFNHADIIQAMVTMAEVCESFYVKCVIKALDIKSVEHQEGLTDNEEIKD